MAYQNGNMTVERIASNQVLTALARLASLIGVPIVVAAALGISSTVTELSRSNAVLVERVAAMQAQISVAASSERELREQQLRAVARDIEMIGKRLDRLEQRGVN